MKKFSLFGRDEKTVVSASRELYKKLGEPVYFQYPYRKESLDEMMWIVYQVIGGYWKPRYLVDERNGTAVEFMNDWVTLLTVTVDDIDWQSLQGLPQKAIERAKDLNAVFPTSILKYKNGVSAVHWQLNPEGRYYMDEDGYGMTDDDEITIYGYVDRAGVPLVKFRAIKNYGELGEMEKEAGKVLASRK